MDRIDTSGVLYIDEVDDIELASVRKVACFLVDLVVIV